MPPRPRAFHRLAVFAAAAAAASAAFVWLRGGPLPFVAAGAAAGIRSYAGTVPAPEFPPGLDWLNTRGRALTLADLRGKVVLLDFWTYGCINCMHVIPDLVRLERRYARELVVIGVHSAKFEHEGRTENIRRIVQRYGLAHPVVNDRFMAIWDAYGARAWPTLVLLDPAGKVVGRAEGEGHYLLLDTIIAGLVSEFDARGAVDRRPLDIGPDPLPATPLRFPSKVLADAAGGRLFIADSGHHRVVVATLDGLVREVIGTGEPGFADGDFRRARFHGPQGLALADATTLYVADTLNHAIRRVDLAARTVTTVAGTGRHGYLQGDSHPARAVPLNSPWDVLWHDGRLYVALAGQHQLWTWEPRSGHVERYAGNGFERLADGTRLAASFNQPSGLASDGRMLYVADSEASAIRAVDLTSGEVRTLVGTGLFDFGDVDGTGTAVRLQHPLGVACWNGAVYIADTYNGRLKRLEPRTRRVVTLAGGSGLLDEPGGLSAAHGRLYLADTNHHAIKVYDLAAGTLREWQLRDPEGLLEDR